MSTHDTAMRTYMVMVACPKISERTRHFSATNLGYIRSQVAGVMQQLQNKIMDESLAGDMRIIAPVPNCGFIFVRATKAGVEAMQAIPGVAAVLSRDDFLSRSNTIAR